MTMFCRLVDKTANSNMRNIIQVCRDNDLLVVNNLYTIPLHSPALSLIAKGRNGYLKLINVWYPLGIFAVTNITVTQDTTLPSDHAPVSIDFSFPEEVDAKLLLHQAQDLCSNCMIKWPARSSCRTVLYQHINVVLFASRLSMLEVSVLDPSENSDVIAKHFADRICMLVQSKAN